MADITSTTINITMPADGSNVTLRANYSKESSGGELLTNVVNVGDYITYVSSSTSYTVSASVSGADSAQTYNPSSITSWRVFSNDGTNVEIISTDSVGDLALKGPTGFIRAVNTLQYLSNAYVNSEYAISGRSLGYSEDGMSEENLQNYKIIKYSLKLIDSSTMEWITYRDNQYQADKTIINSNTMNHSRGNVWLASREAMGGTNAETTGYYVRYIEDDGETSYDCMYYMRSSKSNVEYNYSNGVRPIVLLKDSVIICGGDGSLNNPYRIMDRYAIGYNGNGGAGVMSSQVVNVGDSVELSSNIFTRGGYTFSGWSTSSSAINATYTNGQNIMPTSDMILYAVWKKNCDCCGLTSCSCTNVDDLCGKCDNCCYCLRSPCCNSSNITFIQSFSSNSCYMCGSQNGECGSERYQCNECFLEFDEYYCSYVLE